MKKLKNAGIAIILSLVTGILMILYFGSKIFSDPTILLDESQIPELISSTFPVPLLVIGTILSIVFLFFIYTGFIRFGEISKNKWLKNWSWVLMITLMISTIKEAVFAYLIYYNGSATNGVLITQMIINVIFLIAMIVTFIFFGIGLLKSQESLRFAKATGIVYIISGATMIILVGSLLLFVAQIMSIILFFKASKKFEK